LPPFPPPGYASVQTDIAGAAIGCRFTKEKIRGSVAAQTVKSKQTTIQHFS